MKMLTVGDLYEFIHYLKSTKGLKESDIKKMPIYIGDDDELNGVHSAFFINGVDPENSEDSDNAYNLELIEERAGNVPITGFSLLIS